MGEFIRFGTEIMQGVNPCPCHLLYMGGKLSDKKYYWLKLKENFFNSDDMKVIKSQKNGADYIIFWQQLLLKSITKTEIGILKYKENIPYTPEILATVTDTNIDIVRSALKLFSDLNMIEVRNNGEIWIDSVNELVGSETATAERMRKFRKSKDLKALNAGKDKNKCNKVTKLLQNGYTEIELDKEIETEIKIKKDKNKKDTPNKNKFLDFVMLSDQEHIKLVETLGKESTKDFISRLNNYIGSKGKKYKSHYYTILSWSRKDSGGDKTGRIKTDADFEKEYGKPGGGV